MTTISAEQAAGAPRIGLALGSGGARGWAHLGVLTRLQELQIPIHCVAGTSIGAVMGAAYAANRLPVLEELTRQLDWRRVAKLLLEGSFPRRTGLLSGKWIMQLLQAALDVRRIEELPIPYAAVAANLQTGAPEIFTRGDLIEAIRASIAIPGIFTPARSNDQYLVDGGTLNPLPMEVARALGADVVIAVDVNLGRGRGLTPDTPAPPPDPAIRRIATGILAQLGDPRPVHGALAEAMHRWFGRESAGLSIFDVLTRSARIAENQGSRILLQLHPPTLLIQPAVGDLETLEFHHVLPAMAAGRQAVDDCRVQLQALRPQCAASQSEPTPISTSSGTPRSMA